MIVAELIRLLTQYSGDTRVVIRGYEGGYNDVKLLNPVELKLDHESSCYYGQHADAEYIRVRPDALAVELWGRNELSMYPDTLPTTP